MNKNGVNIVNENDCSDMRQELQDIKEELKSLKELIKNQPKNETQIIKFADKRQTCFTAIMTIFGASISIGLFALQAQSNFMAGINVVLIVLMVVFFALMAYYNWQITRQLKQAKSTNYS